MDSLSTVDKFGGPNVSFIKKSHCIRSMLRKLLYVQLDALHTFHQRCYVTIHAKRVIFTLSKHEYGRDKEFLCTFVEFAIIG